MSSLISNLIHSPVTDKTSAPLDLTAAQNKFADTLSTVGRHSKPAARYEPGTTSTATTPYGGITNPVQDGIWKTLKGILNIAERLPPVLGQFLVGKAAYNTNSEEPTVGQLLLSSLNVMMDPKGTPPSLTPMTKDGVPMGVVNSDTGLLSQAWKTKSNEIIIGFGGTMPVGAYGTPWYNGAAKVADVDLFNGKVSLAQKDALIFTKEVQAEATKQGLDPSKVFLTGLSLGAEIASYVANETDLPGLGGVTPGIPASLPKGRGDNFYNVLSVGDPISMADKDFSVLAPPLGENMSHYGLNIFTKQPLLAKIQTGLSTAFVASKPRNISMTDYALNSFLKLTNVVSGDLGSLRDLRPIPLIWGTYSVLNHVFAAAPLAIASLGKTPSEMYRTNQP